MNSETQAVNPYGKELTQEEINAGVHRGFVGDMWDELGALQFEFMRENGLKPHHCLLDIGCGALRGGVHFVRYLDEGHYYGYDINASLIEAGKQELQRAGLQGKKPHLLVESAFKAQQFGRAFDFAVALSVFTHLPMNHIIRCLTETRRVLGDGAILFATIFEAPTSAHIEKIQHSPGGIVTNYDSDPYHYSLDEIEWMARLARFRVGVVEAWEHPRAQKMLSFSAM